MAEAKRECLAVTGDYVSDLRAFCAEWLKQNRGYDLIDHGFGAEHGGELTTGKLLAALDELDLLRAEVDIARHEAKQCTAVYEHPIYGVRRCELPAHGYTEHFAGSAGGWVKWTDTALRQPERVDGGQ